MSQEKPSGKLEQIIDYLFLEESEKILRALRFGNYKDNSKYLDDCQRSAKDLIIRKPVPGVNGSILGVIVETKLSPEELNEIRRALDDKFTELVKSGMEKIAEEVNAKDLQKAIDKVEEIVRKHGGVCSCIKGRFDKDWKLYAIRVDAEIPGISELDINIRCSNEEEFSNDLNIFKNIIENKQNEKFKREKEDLIAEINEMTFQPKVESIIEPLNIGMAIEQNYYPPKVINYTLDYQGEIILRRWYKTTDDLEHETEFVRKFSEGFRKVIDLLEERLLTLSHSDCYKRGRVYTHTNNNKPGLNLHVERYDEYVFMLEVNLEEINFESLDIQITNLINITERIDRIIDEMVHNEFNKWRFSINEEFIRISKQDDKHYGPKYISIGSSYEIDENEIRTAISEILKAESNFKKVSSDVDRIFKGREETWRITETTPGEKYVVYIYCPKKKTYVTADVTPEDYTRIHEILNQIDTEEKSLKEMEKFLKDMAKSIENEFKGYPVSVTCEESKTAFSWIFRVAIPNQPAVVRIIHSDKRKDREIRDLKNAVYNKLRQLHLIK